MILPQQLPISKLQKQCWGHELTTWYIRFQVLNLLIIPAPSGPPQSVVCSPRSQSAITVQWQPPNEADWNGLLLGYTISYNLLGYPDHTRAEEKIRNSNTRQYIIEGLITFQVRSSNHFKDFEICLKIYIYSSWKKCQILGIPFIPVKLL